VRCLAASHRASRDGPSTSVNDTNIASPSYTTCWDVTAPSSCVVRVPPCLHGARATVRTQLVGGDVAPARRRLLQQRPSSHSAGGGDVAPEAQLAELRTLPGRASRGGRAVALRRPHAEDAPLAELHDTLANHCARASMTRRAMTTAEPTRSATCVRACPRSECGRSGELATLGLLRCTPRPGVQEDSAAGTRRAGSAARADKRTGRPIDAGPSGGYRTRLASTRPRRTAAMMACVRFCAPSLS
jgi:hypothetical protein